MLFYWLFVVPLRKLVWLLKVPKPEQFAVVNPNAKCPVCGHFDGWLRCVLRAQPGAAAINPRSPLFARQQLQQGMIVCQHTCRVCGARWHDKPVAKNADPTTVMAGVPRNDLEKTEDRHAYLEADENVSS